MLRRICTTSCVFLLLALVSSAAFACRCVPPTIAKAYGAAELIITGSIRKVDGVFDDPDGAQVTIDVQENWKGMTSELLDVNTRSNCAYHFKVGRSYLIFVRKDATTKRLTTNICVGNRPIEEAGAAISWLRNKTGTAKKR